MRGTELYNDLRLTTILGGAAAWVPIDLANLLAWYDPSDATTRFQERTGASATTTANNGDPVGTLLDKSGNGYHFTAPADDRRPTYTESGGLKYLSLDGVNDYLSYAAQVLQNATTCSVFAGFRKDAADTRGGIFDGNNAGKYVLLYQESSTSNPYSGVSNFNGYIDDVILSPAQRGQLHDDLDDGAFHVVETRDFTPINWTAGIGIGYIGGGGLTPHGDYSGVVVAQDVTAEERDNLYAYLNGKSGL